MNYIKKSKKIEIIFLTGRNSRPELIYNEFNELGERSK